MRLRKVRCTVSSVDRYVLFDSSFIANTDLDRLLSYSLRQVKNPRSSVARSRPDDESVLQNWAIFSLRKLALLVQIQVVPPSNSALTKPLTLGSFSQHSRAV